jgi:hypothetical protein
MEQLSKATKNTGYSVSGSRFKPDTSQIQSRNIPHSTAKFGRCFLCIESHSNMTVNDDDLEGCRWNRPWLISLYVSSGVVLRSNLLLRHSSAKEGMRDERTPFLSTWWSQQLSDIITRWKPDAIVCPLEQIAFCCNIIIALAILLRNTCCSLFCWTSVL